MKLNEIIKLFLLFMPSIIFAKNKTKIVDLNTKIIFDDKMVNKVFLDKTITGKSWNCNRQICPAVIISSLKKKSHSGLFCFKAIENANETEFSVFERCKGSSDWLR